MTVWVWPADFPEDCPPNAATPANWRIVFSFDGENVCDVDLVDYH